MKNIIKRTTLFVRDMEVSKTWYEDVLGFSVWMDDIVTLSGTGKWKNEEISWIIFI